MLAIHSDISRAYWRVLRAAASVAAAMEQKIAGTLPARRKVLIDRLMRLLSDLEPDRKTGLVLANGRTVHGIAMCATITRAFS
jgi:hypothetical protein